MVVVVKWRGGGGVTSRMEGAHRGGAVAKQGRYEALVLQTRQQNTELQALPGQVRITLVLVLVLVL